MKIYIAGKIKNNPSYIDDFKAMEECLLIAGNSVMSPSILPQGFEEREYWDICKSMINVCDVVYFLPNWTESKGSHFEMGYCEGINKRYVIL